MNVSGMCRPPWYGSLSMQESLGSRRDALVAVHVDIKINWSYNLV